MSYIVYNILYIIYSGVVIIEKPGIYYVSVGGRNPYDDARLGIGIRLNNSRIVYADKWVWKIVFER